MRKNKTIIAGQCNLDGRLQSETRTMAGENTVLLLRELEQMLPLLDPARRELAALCTPHPQVKRNVQNEDMLQKEIRELQRDNAEFLDALQKKADEYCMLDKKSKQQDEQIEQLETEKRKQSQLFQEINRQVLDIKGEKERLCLQIEEQNSKYQMLEKRCESQRQENLSLQAQIKPTDDHEVEYERQIRHLESDQETLKEELRTAKERVSSLLGDRLTLSAGVSDLSDPYGPIKIAEMYSALYDDQWTDAYQVSEVVFQGKGEKNRVKKLIQVFGLVHKFCKEKQHQDANILRAMFRKSANNCEQLPQDVNRILRDVLRVSYEMAIGNINKKFSEELDNSKVVCKFASEIPQFVEACFHICWLMLMHDPPVVIQKNVTKGSPFDKGSYKPYMTTGDKIDYVVWPALLLHEDGPVIAKGVVECFRSTAYIQKTTCIKPEKQQVGYPEIDDAHARFDNNFDDID